MSKKKTTIVDEGTQISQIIDQEATKMMGAPIKDGNLVVEVEEESKKEETPKEEIKETPKEETPIEFDPDKFAEQTAEKVKKVLKEDAVEREKELTAEEKKAKEDEELIPIYVREGRNPKDYAEINDEAQRIAEIKFNRTLDAREAAARAKEEETAKAREAELAKSKQFEEDFNKMIDEELNEMYTNNKLPKIVDEKDPDDPGIKARFELFKTMKEVNEKRVTAGQQPITSISRIYNNYYKLPTSQPAGADAPVSAGRGVVTEEKEEVMPYAKLHNSSFLDFFRIKK